MASFSPVLVPIIKTKHNQSLCYTDGLPALNLPVGLTLLSLSMAFCSENRMLSLRESKDASFPTCLILNRHLKFSLDLN